MASIKPLSETVLSTVRSGFIISSLSTVVEELVYNSLDASAKKVAILVGVNNGYIKVEDDGSGIDRDGLMLLGERYATSKVDHLNKEDDSVGSFGFRGEVLCSIADISLIEILTKIQGRPNGYRKVMKGRRCLYLSIDDKQDVGTTVIVRDLFYNQPVRRRQLQSSTKKVLHAVRECVIRIALVQPKVAFRVVDMESDDELLCTHASPSPLSLLCSNFGIESSSLCKLSFSEGLLKLTGYVSSPSSLLTSKAIQYIYVNSRFVVKGPIHKALTCLAEMCWDRFRGDKGGKRTQSHAGPSYCLNLACPRISYDLNLGVSGTSVEFKDWTPVIRFIEKSVALFWSKKKRKGESSNCEADEMQTNGMEKLAADSSFSKKNWRFKSCENTTKRRRTENPENVESFSEDLHCCMEMKVEDRSSSSLWDSSCEQPKKSTSKTLQFKEPEKEREYSLCGNDDCDNVREYELFDKNYVESDENCAETYPSHTRWEVGMPGDDVGARSHSFMQRDDNCAEMFSSRTGWGVEIPGDDVGARSRELESGFDIEYKHDYDRTEDKLRHRKLLLGSPLGDNTLETPPSCGRLSRYQFDNFEATSRRSTGSGDVDGLCEDPDVFQLACSQWDVANTWLLPKRGTKSLGWKDIEAHSLPLCASSSYRQPKYLSDEVSEYRSSYSQQHFCQHSPIQYSFPNMKDWDLDNVVKNDGVQRTSERRNYGLYIRDDDGKDEFCQSAFGDRCMNENLSSASSLNTKLIQESGYAGVERRTLKMSIDNCSSDDIPSIAYGALLAKATNSPSSDMMLSESPFSWSPPEPINRGVQMDLQSCQTLGLLDITKDSSLTSHGKRYPESPLFASSDDILIAKTVSSPLDFRSNINSYEPSPHSFSSTSISKDLRIDLQGCQPFETSHSPSKQFDLFSKRPRRSHSAPPIYPGRRRFMSVGDCLNPATDNPVLNPDSQIHNVSERATLNPSCGSPRLCNESSQDDEMIPEEDPHFWTDHQLKGEPIISQDKMLTQDVKADDSGYFKEVQDVESSRVKWREGCQDTTLKRITNCRSVGDSLDEFKEENRILDVQSCKLYLAGDSLVPKSINRSFLESAKVLSQVESKFIPVVGSGILAVIDQHAADERIRLEEMRQKILSGELLSITYLKEEKELVLPEIGYQLLCNYAESIQHWGWKCNIFRQEPGSFSKNLDLLNDHASHPRLLAVPCVLGVKLSDVDLLEYLEQLADTDGSSTIPPSVVRILNYKACRGAIMFGDKLLPSECSLIVEELKRTSLCFQCAHGRPTTAPLVNLKALHRTVLQLGSSRKGSKMVWHGLHKNNINVERAKHRLDVARGC
ncbi:DNA mismatch repair protein MLH3 isoform X2 [Silene latifolia]|uniref:DNA mismatch repair protein MLH3 isoform X2 n=1 Tax=Silene latifolia TaxID=37657 RepID=UPI003D76FFF0